MASLFKAPIGTKTEISVIYDRPINKNKFFKREKGEKQFSRISADKYYELYDKSNSDKTIFVRPPITVEDNEST